MLQCPGQARWLTEVNFCPVSSLLLLFRMGVSQQRLFARYRGENCFVYCYNFMYSYKQPDRQLNSHFLFTVVRKETLRSAGHCVVPDSSSTQTLDHSGKLREPQTLNLQSLWCRAHVVGSSVLLLRKWMCLDDRDGIFGRQQISVRRRQMININLWGVVKNHPGLFDTQMGVVIVLYCWLEGIGNKSQGKERSVTANVIYEIRNSK